MHIVSLDIETHRITDDYPLPKPVVVALNSDETGPVVITGDVVETVGALLSDSNVHLNAHKAAYDFGCLAQWYPDLRRPILEAYDTNRIRCTMAWSQLTDFRDGIRAGQGRSHALDVVCARRGIPCHDKDSPWRKRFGELDGIPYAQWPREPRQYVYDDIVVQHALAMSFFTSESVLPNVAQQSAYYYWLELSRAMGMLSDPDRVRLWEAELRAEQAKHIATIRQAGLIRWNDKRKAYSVNQSTLRERLAAAGSTARTKPSKTHPKGQLKIDATTCEDSADPILLSYAGWKTAEYNLTTELPRFKAPIVRTEYYMAISGRTTSEKPNMQNLGPTARLCVKPRLGRLFVCADYSILELCTLAQLCVALGFGDKLAIVLRNGGDPHNDFGAAIAGLPLEQALLKPGFKKNERQLAKAANYGFPGGLGPKTFVTWAWKRYRIRLTVGEASSLRRQWRRQWPEVKRLQDYISRHLDTGEPIEHYMSRRLRGKCTYTQACNTVFQGLGADVTKAAGWALFKAGYEIALFVHDEYVIEVPEDQAEYHATRIKQILEDVARLWLPDVGCRCTPVIGKVWAH